MFGHVLQAFLSDVSSYRYDSITQFLQTSQLHIYDASLPYQHIHRCSIRSRSGDWSPFEYIHWHQPESFMQGRMDPCFHVFPEIYCPVFVNQSSEDCQCGLEMEMLSIDVEVIFCLVITSACLSYCCLVILL